MTEETNAERLPEQHFVKASLGLALAVPYRKENPT